MTDQTVPVPVALLKELKASYRGSQREIDAPWDEVTTTLDGTAYDRVIALIPVPPKVGDSIDAADQIAALPDHSVLIDTDGEPWTVVGGEPLYYVDGKRENRGLLVRTYGPLTLVHLGTTSD